MRGRYSKRIRVVLLCVIAMVAIAVLGVIYCCSSGGCGRTTCMEISRLLKQRVVLDGAGAVAEEDDAVPGNTLIYVLGGNQINLSARYAVAAELYRRNRSHAIHFLSRKGITEFSFELKRNLKNDEWSVRELGYHGVRADDAVPVQVPDGVLGTLVEAEAVAKLAREKRYGRVVLVSSMYHTRRVEVTFRNVLSPDPPEIRVFGARDNDDLDLLLEEYVKLLAYEYLALPARKARLFLEAARDGLSVPFSGRRPPAEYRTEIANTDMK